MTRPEMSSQTRLIVGIDYGTTFSGVSFALSTVTNPNEINVWSTFPRAGQHKAETYPKAPSWVSLPEENEDGEFLWGYEVETGMTTRQWMKLMLDSKANTTKYDDPRAKDVMTGVTSPLPGDWTPLKIVTAYLRAMYCMVMKGLQKYFDNTLLESMPMDIWLTVPAVWSDAAKLLTKKAAREAGVASRPGDTLQLIAEPEAAAHVAIREAVHKSIEVVEAGSGVLICDAGGGTVDITTYKIVSSEPQLILHEICPGAGGKCGGSFIDRNLHDLLAARFGEAYLSLPEEERGASSNFMDAFEHAKQDVSAHDPSTRKTKLQLDMPRLRQVPGHQEKYEDYYSFKSRSVLLSHDDWKTLFDPVVDRVISLVKDQITEANEVCQIRNVVLVGGFGESNYLFDRLKDACNPHVNVRTPLCRPWSAVMRGAVLCGLENSAVQEWKCRRHYGFRCSGLFNQGLHGHIVPNGENGQQVVDEWSNERYITGIMEWKYKRGEMIREETEFDFPFITRRGVETSKSLSSTLPLYASREDEAPEVFNPETVESVGEIRFNLQNIDWSSQTQHRRHDGKLYYQIDLVCRLRLGDRAGHMTMKLLHEGKEIAEGKLDLV